ncbi:acyltransferase [Escherichia coli]|nr:acyltransferase [Escherichia coli]EFJ2961877.1 acyltransferase [Escherichia coli]
MNNKGNIIQGLTSLRMFAALGVFVSHLGLLSQSSIGVFNTAAKYFFNGYIGVTFFYILSGFIINYSFINHVKKEAFSNKDFIVYRIARIFPVHIVALLCFILIFMHGKMGDGISKEMLISNVFLVQSFIPIQDYYFSFNSVSWSISCEMFFYVSFCFLTRLKTKYLACVLLFVLVINFYFLINPPITISQHWLFYINPVFRIGDFIIGMMLCRVFINTSARPNNTVCSIIEIASILSLLLTVYIATNYITYMNIKYDVLYIPCMAFIVIAFAFNGGILSKILKNRFMVLLGEASFSFYMFHWMIIQIVTKILSVEKDNFIDMLVYVVLSLFVSIIASILSFKLIEMPINKTIRRCWKKYRGMQSVRSA